MILMFDARSGKHLVCKLRKATDDETAQVTALYDTTTMDATTVGGHSNIHNSMKNSLLRQSFNLSHHNSPADIYRSNLASSLVDSPIHRNSISVVARKIGECEPSKPLVPDLDRKSTV